MADVVALTESDAAAGKATTTVPMVQRALSRGGNRPDPGDDLQQAPVGVVSHHHPARRTPGAETFRLERVRRPRAPTARPARVGQDGRVYADHHLISLAGSARSCDLGCRAKMTASPVATASPHALTAPAVPPTLGAFPRRVSERDTRWRREWNVPGASRSSRRARDSARRAVPPLLRRRRVSRTRRHPASCSPSSMPSRARRHGCAALAMPSSFARTVASAAGSPGTERCAPLARLVKPRPSPSILRTGAPSSASGSYTSVTFERPPAEPSPTLPRPSA
jgi:hypothetical protein